MKIVDRCSLRNKKVEKMLRELDQQVSVMELSNVPTKTNFMECFLLTLELMIEAFRMMENNTVPGKTLLEYTGMEVQDACNRVGESKNFDNDRDYVIAVMQELTK